MKKLLLKILRDIKQSKGQFIAIILIIGVGAFLSTGLSTLSNSLSSYITKYYEDSNLSDLYVYYDHISSDNISTLEKIDGINKIEGRVTFDATQSFNDLKTDLKIYSIPENNNINKSFVIEGNIPKNKDEILIDSLYAKEHNYKIGNKIKITANNSEFEFIISGFGENAQHAFNIKDPSLVIPDHKIYGIAYISEERIPDILGSNFYNELMITAKNNYDIETISESIESKSKDFTYLYNLPKERTISYFALDTNMKSNKSMGLILPLIIFIVASVITYLTMSRIIDSQRNQIGIMKALGIKSRNIIFHYISYSVFIGLIGSISGATFGFISFIKIGNAQYNQIYSFPNFKLSIDIFNIIPALIFSISFGIIASYFSCRKILKECAAQAMRPKPPKKSKPIFIERFPSFWKKISYGNKLVLRNIFLTKQRALFTSSGVIVCVVLLIISFGYITSMSKLGNQIDKVNNYDLRIDYNSSITSDSLDLPSSVKNYYTLSEIPVEFISSTTEEDTTLLVTEKENTLINITDNNNDKISFEDTGVVISKAFADKYNISKGDSIELNFISPDLKGTSIYAKVSNISIEAINQLIYCTKVYLETFDINYTPTTILVKLDNSSNINTASTFLNNNDFVSKITTIDDLKDTFNTSVKQSYPAFITFIVSAIVLSAAAIYTISSINIFDRIRELATLKVLGYQKRQINKLIFFENIVITIFSIIIALPLGFYSFKLFIQVLADANQIFPEKLTIIPIIISILLTLFVTLISNLLLRRKVTKIDMIESLKSVE